VRLCELAEGQFELSVEYKHKGGLGWTSTTLPYCERVPILGKERDYGTAESYYQSAEVIIANGQHYRAITDFRAALRIGPNHKASRDTLSKLGISP
jgi:hypothetical protein